MKLKKNLTVSKFYRGTFLKMVMTFKQITNSHNMKYLSVTGFKNISATIFARPWSGANNKKKCMFFFFLHACQAAERRLAMPPMT